MGDCQSGKDKTLTSSEKPCWQGPPLNTARGSLSNSTEENPQAQKENQTNHGN